MKNKFKKSLENYCKNCNKYGHRYSDCRDPITSCGIICINIDNKELTEDLKTSLLNIKPDPCPITLKDEQDLYNFCYYKDNIKFLLIKRKHTLGYIDFLRGHYDIYNIEGIIYLFKQMIQEEIDSIAIKDFDKLWGDFWGCKKQTDEYHISKKKFNDLKSNIDDVLPLNFYTTNVKPIWESSEWGLPKGRRNYLETDLICGIREFTEETGLSKDDFTVLSKNPYVEEFVGTNGVDYRHIYYLAYSNKTDLKIDKSVYSQFYEIGDISWLSYESSINIIRPYHTDRKKILTNVFTNCINLIKNHVL